MTCPVCREPLGRKDLIEIPPEEVHEEPEEVPAPLVTAATGPAGLVQGASLANPTKPLRLVADMKAILAVNPNAKVRFD